MLRSLFRSPRSVRVPIQNGSVDLQRVAITRRSKSSPVFYRVFMTVAVTYFVARTINHYYPDSAHGSTPTTNTAGRTRKPEEGTKLWQGHWDQAKDTTSQTESGVIHLMLPIWIRKQKPKPWQAEDPLWKSFQALEDDKKRMKEIVEATKKQLLRAVLFKFGPVLMDLGSRGPAGQAKLRLHDAWMMVPPLYAPATYEIPCIFVQPNKTSYGWRQLPNSVGAKMDRVFHPLALATAFFYGVKEFTWASYLITKTRLIDQINSSNTTEKDAEPPKKTSTKDENALKQLRLGRIPEEQKALYLPFLRGEYGEHESRRAYRDLVKSMTYQGAIESGCAVFRAQWVRGQEKSMQSYSRESRSVVFRGNVSFIGEKGILQLHVVAVYSTESNSLVGQPIIQDAFLIPNMEKWVSPRSSERSKTDLEPNKGKSRLEKMEAENEVPRPTAKPPSLPQEDVPRPEKSQGGQDEEETKK